MPIDARIPLAVQGAQVNGDSILKFAQIKQAKEYREANKGRQEKQDKLLDLQIAETNLKTLNAREQRRFANLATDSLQVNTFLKNNDKEGARSVLEKRKANLLKLQEFDPPRS